MTPATDALPTCAERDQLFVGDDTIRVLHERSIAALPWRELGVDVVLDCTGVYGNREHGEAHLTAGAKKSCSLIPAVTTSTQRSFSASISMSCNPNTVLFQRLLHHQLHYSGH